MVQWGTCCIALRASSNGQHTAQISVLRVISPSRSGVLASCSTHWCSWSQPAFPSHWCSEGTLQTSYSGREQASFGNCAAHRTAWKHLLPEQPSPLSPSKVLALWLVCVLLNSFISVMKVPEFVLFQFQWVLAQWQQQRNFLLWKVSRAPGNIPREAVLSPAGCDIDLEELGLGFSWLKVRSNCVYAFALGVFYFFVRYKIIVNLKNKRVFKIHAPPKKSWRPYS